MINEKILAKLLIIIMYVVIGFLIIIIPVEKLLLTTVLTCLTKLVDNIIESKKEDGKIKRDKKAVINLLLYGPLGIYIFILLSKTAIVSNENMRNNIIEMFQVVNINILVFSRFISIDILKFIASIVAFIESGRTIYRFNTDMNTKDRISKENQILSKVKEEISKENQTLLKIKEEISKENQTLLKIKEKISKENQILSKVKEEISKENQTLLKVKEEISNRDQDLLKLKEEENQKGTSHELNKI